MPMMPDSMHTSARKIYEWYEAQPRQHREHLGASLIGHHCDRYLWLTFRWAASPAFKGRTLRLFETGKREESRVYTELRAIGVELHTEADGKQIECRDETGHFGGSLDGIGLGFPEAPKTWAVLEIKTFNAKSFGALKLKGVQAEKPQHWAQMQTYMGLMQLDRALYIAVNKDTDDLHTEWVHFDQGAYTDISCRAARVIERTSPAERISEDPANWQCKMCDMYNLCHQKAEAEFNCRTCCHATPVADGEWHCSMLGKMLTVKEQRVGCDSHLFIPALVHGEPIDGGVNHIEYLDRETGKTFTDGPKASTGLELCKPPRSKSYVPGSAPKTKFFDDEIPF